MRREQGFSLIELMIVVAIIIILATIAIPSYRRYVVRSHRTEAQRALLDLAAREERYFYTNNKYAGSLSDLASASTVDGNNYSLSIDPAVAASTDYSLTATAIGQQQRDDQDCQTLSLNRAGSRTATGAAPNASATCWGQ
jgi:type IV pilus assembly protein PilE